MIEFILNNKHIKTALKPSSVLLDFIRYDQHLKGTKIGCREGDCGACTVLVGSLKETSVVYETMTSCLTPLGNVEGKHVVTIEGINIEELTPVQAALDQHGGTQCGFCTPGFVMSLTGFVLSQKEHTFENAMNAVAGNICRCTGYKSIERAMTDIVKGISGISALNDLVDKNYLPDYFKTIPERLKNLKVFENSSNGKIIGGGTDLYVQRPDEISDSEAIFKLNDPEFRYIEEEDGFIKVGASVTVSDIMYSGLFISIFPKIKTWFKLISSEQIRNMATVAGNFVNASPIGDISIFFMALNSRLNIRSKNGTDREIHLKDFFKAYKTLDLNEGEAVTEVKFEKPSGAYMFNFEKVSKRTYLDIASVNSACFLRLNDSRIEEIHISGGGLAPIPVYFRKTRDFLIGKEIKHETLKDASEILLSEVSPISDIRGSKEYKSLLLTQLFFLHFEEMNCLSIV